MASISLGQVNHLFWNIIYIIVQKKNIEIPTDLVLDAYIENLKDTLQGCIERAKEQSIRDSDKRRGIYYLNKK